LEKLVNVEEKERKRGRKWPRRNPFVVYRKKGKKRKKKGKIEAKFPYVQRGPLTSIGLSKSVRGTGIKGERKRREKGGEPNVPRGPTIPTNCPAP